MKHLTIIILLLITLNGELFARGGLGAAAGIRGGGSSGGGTAAGVRGGGAGSGVRGASSGNVSYPRGTPQWYRARAEEAASKGQYVDIVVPTPPRGRTSAGAFGGGYGDSDSDDYNERRARKLHYSEMESGAGLWTWLKDLVKVALLPIRIVAVIVTSRDLFDD